MLQSPSLSKVYGHGHIKKFWLLQNQKESESKALVASSSTPPCRHVSSSAGLGHESKQSPQISLGSTTARSLTPLSGAFVRPLVSGPACLNMAMAGHASLVTCAKSLSPPLCTDQSRSGLRPTSPSSSVSMLKGERISAAENDLSSRCSPDADNRVCVSMRHSDPPSELGHKLSRDFSYGFPLSPQDGSDSSAYDHLSLSKVQQQDVQLQDRCDHVCVSDNKICKVHKVKPYKCNMGILSNLDSCRPFAVPFQLPEKFFLEAEAKPFDEEAASEFLDRSHQGTSGPVPVPLNAEWNESVPVRTAEAASKDGYGVNKCGLRTCSLCGTSKTPLWRGGPQGPKSLCNACGIRFKKSKRSSGGGEGSPMPSSQFVKSAFKPAKRKQETPANSDAHSARPSVLGGAAPIPGLATQVAKKRRRSKLIKKGEWVVSERGDATGSSGESSLTWNLHSPSAVSSPSVVQFERLSIDENTTTLNIVPGKDEEAAAVLLMYMSCGLVFA